MAQPFRAERLLHAYGYLGTLWRLAMLYCMPLHWGIFCAHCVFYHFSCCTAILFWPQIHTLTQHWHYFSHHPPAYIRTTTATRRPVHSTNFLGDIGQHEYTFELHLPCDQLTYLQYVIHKWVRKHACAQRDLESFLGHLSCAATVIFQGCIFFRQLFSLLSRGLAPTTTSIRLNLGARADSLWWHAGILARLEWNTVLSSHFYR